MGVNHSALSWVLWSSDNKRERSVTGVDEGDGEGVWARRFVKAVEMSSRMVRAKV
jgi:hypothetical protein